MRVHACWDVPDCHFVCFNCHDLLAHLWERQAGVAQLIISHDGDRRSDMRMSDALLSWALT